MSDLVPVVLDDQRNVNSSFDCQEFHTIQSEDREKLLEAIRKTCCFGLDGGCDIISN